MAIYFPLPYILRPPFGPDSYARKGTGNSYIYQRYPKYPHRTPHQKAFAAILPILRDVWNDPDNWYFRQQWEEADPANIASRPDRSQTEKNAWLRFTVATLALYMTGTGNWSPDVSLVAYTLATASVSALDPDACTVTINWTMNPPLDATGEPVLFVHQIHPLASPLGGTPLYRDARIIGAFDMARLTGTSFSETFTLSWPEAPPIAPRFLVRLHNTLNPVSQLLITWTWP